MLIGGQIEGTDQVKSVRVDANGYVYVIGTSGSPIYCQVGDDAAGGGPYYLMTDANGALLIGYDGANGTLLRTDVDGRLQLANWTAITNSNRTEEIDPISTHYVSERLAEVTNGADATYQYYTDMADYQHWGLQLILDCVAGTVTATVEATCLDDGTAPAACPYEDVTNAWFGVANLQAAAGAASAIWLAEHVPGACKYVRVVIVANTGAATGDWALYHKRLY